MFIPHTANNIATWISESLEKFEITRDQVFIFATDNAANMLAGVRNFQKMLEVREDEELLIEEASQTHPLVENIYEEIEFDSNEEIHIEEEVLCFNEEFVNDDELSFSMGCTCHTLQLAVNDFLKSSKEASNTVAFAQKLTKKLKNQGIANMLKTQKLPQSIIMHSIRWRYIFTCLDRLLQLKEFCKTNESMLAALKVSDIVWNNFNLLRDALEPISILTIKLQSERLDIPSFVSDWNISKLKLRKINSCYASKLLKCIENREVKIFSNIVVKSGCYVDKRFSISLTEEDVRESKNLIRKLHRKIQKISVPLSSSVENITSRQNDENPVTENQVTEISDNFELLEEMLQSYDGENSQNSSIRLLNYDEVLESELLKFDLIPRLRADADIRAFWLKQKVNFPVLSNIALHLISVPLTEVSVEQLFSFVNFTMGDHRFNLKGDILNDIIFIGMNHRFSVK